MNQLFTVTVPNVALPSGTGARNQRVWDTPALTAVWSKTNSQSLIGGYVIRKALGTVESTCLKCAKRGCTHSPRTLNEQSMCCNFQATSPDHTFQVCTA